MSRFGLKNVIVLLGIVVCVGLLQRGASAEGIAIALRAPTSKYHRLVKFPHTGVEELIGKGLELSLPKNTSISFSVDQVNTVLYEVEVRVTEEKPKQGNSLKSFDFSKIIDQIGGAKAFIEMVLSLTDVSALRDAGEHSSTSETPSIADALVELEQKIQKVSDLNKELDALLYRTEDPEFYACGVTKVNDKFNEIRTDAKTATEKNFPPGTSQAIYESAKAAIQKVRDAAKDPKIEAALGLPKDLSDTSNDIATAFRTVAGKLRAIETATWSKFNTETQILKNQIKFTCVFTPKEGNPKLQPITRVVTITRVPTGWILMGTQGAFMSGLVDETPGSSSGSNTSETDESGKEDTVRLSTGGLIHAFHSKFKYGGLTVGLGVDGAKNLQVALGLSFLIHADEEKLFALTFGGIAGAVKTYNGSAEEDQSNRISWFGAITLNFNSLFGEKEGQ